VLWFSSCWSGVELRVMCPVCSMQQWCPKHVEQAIRSAIKTSIAYSWHFIYTYCLYIVKTVCYFTLVSFHTCHFQIKLFGGEISNMWLWVTEGKQILRYLFFFCSGRMYSDFYKSTNYINVFV